MFLRNNPRSWQKDMPRFAMCPFCKGKAEVLVYRAVVTGMKIVMPCPDCDKDGDGNPTGLRRA